MANVPREMTLKEFIESTWFKGLARIGFIIVIPLISGLGGWMYHEFTAQGARLSVIEKDTAVRIIKADERDKAVDKAIINMTAIQSAQAADISSIRQDVATINGKLSVILKERTEQTSELYRGILPVPVSSSSASSSR